MMKIIDHKNINITNKGSLNNDSTHGGKFPFELCHPVSLVYHPYNLISYKGWSAHRILYRTAMASSRFFEDLL